MSKNLLIYFIVTSIVLSIAIPTYNILTKVEKETSYIISDTDSEENKEESEIKIIQFITQIRILHFKKKATENIHITKHFNSIEKKLELPPPEWVLVKASKKMNTLIS